MAEGSGGEMLGKKTYRMLGDTSIARAFRNPYDSGWAALNKWFSDENLRPARHQMHGDKYIRTGKDVFCVTGHDRRGRPLHVEFSTEAIAISMSSPEWEAMKAAKRRRK